MVEYIFDLWDPGLMFKSEEAYKNIIMSKHSLDENLKPNSVFVEDAEAQADLGSYSRNVNARCDQINPGVYSKHLIEYKPADIDRAESTIHWLVSPKLICMIGHSDSAKSLALRITSKRFRKGRW